MTTLDSEWHLRLHVLIKSRLLRGPSTYNPYPESLSKIRTQNQYIQYKTDPYIQNV